MSLVRENLHAPRMGKLYDRFYIRADAVIGRVVDEHRNCVRIVLDGLFYFFDLHSQRNTEFLVHLRIYVDRDSAAEHQRVDDALMYVSRQDDLISGFYHREDHALDRRCRSAYHQIGTGRSECLRRKLFRLTDHGDRMTEVVKRLHGVYVQRYTFFA